MATHEPKHQKTSPVNYQLKPQEYAGYVHSESIPHALFQTLITLLHVTPAVGKTEAEPAAKAAYMESHPAKVVLIIIGGRHLREVPIFSEYILGGNGL